MREECPRKGKWIGGCYFTPRYDVSEPIIPPTLKRAERFYPKEWVRTTYVADVCVTCGRVIHRLDKTT